MGIGSSIASAIHSKRAADEQRRKQSLIAQKEAEDKSLFNKQYYQDITKRTEVQNMMRMLNEGQKKADTAVAARAAVTGATPEQQLAGQEVNRKSYADAVADIASNASMLRDQYMRDYQGRRDRTYAQRLGMQDQLAAIESNTSGQWANAAVNAFSTGAQLLGAGIDGARGGMPRNNVEIDPSKPAAGAGSTYVDTVPAPVSASDKLSNLGQKLGFKS